MLFTNSLSLNKLKQTACWLTCLKTYCTFWQTQYVSQLVYYHRCHFSQLRSRTVWIARSQKSPMITEITEIEESQWTDHQKLKKNTSVHWKKNWLCCELATEENMFTQCTLNLFTDHRKDFKMSVAVHTDPEHEKYKRKNLRSLSSSVWGNTHNVTNQNWRILEAN